jgi:hypothetical protein
MDLPFSQGKIHTVQRFGARKRLTDPAHRQYRVVLHLGSPSRLNAVRAVVCFKESAV